ncbi:glycerol kinase GlpK [Amantichitinum ursilacus]|uniref:Glycerol kinase n=1 Tax=Amantichitinum ursilacus TaxID=857265 RepID=A0A0N1JSB0_9NEIS|nr:glycerol kinase GlpK [Amantichitinum ursilacus]KPC51540.1 Glycerol kinase [Amantichitinum ursilacus]
MPTTHKYLLAFDQGTTSSRAIVFNHEGAIVQRAQREFRQIYPQPGWVEHDPQEIWGSQVAVAAQAVAMAGLQATDIAAIGITNQRETTLLWDRATGQPVYNAIVWQDRRTAAWCDQLKHDGHADLVKSKTGLPIDAYFSASKLKWLLDKVPDARRRANKGELAFGTVDSWLIWNLTQGQQHLTDVSNAARTMLFNIHTLAWDDDLLRLFDIPRSVLPEVRGSSEIVGYTRNVVPGGVIALAGIAGDQHAALFGQQCTQPGMVKNTYGTGCFLMMNTGPKPMSSQHNLLSTVAWQINGQTTYALEGSIFTTGAVIKWLRDGLGLIRHASEIDALARSVPDTGGVVLVPAFAGLGAPHWNANARGSLFGATLGTTSAHIARAALESIALQTLDVLDAMRADSGMTVSELRVDGGATASDLLLQCQADLLQLDVIRPQVTETTALGAAYLAGLAVGYWNDLPALQDQWQLQQRFSPQASAEDVNRRVAAWQRAVKAAVVWADMG